LAAIASLAAGQEAITNHITTEKKSFSKASTSFATDLLKDLGISYELRHSSTHDTTDTEAPNFSWVRGGGDVGKEDEDQRTPAACDYVTTLLDMASINDRENVVTLEVADVHNNDMFPLQGHHKTATGKTDLVVREVANSHINQLCYAAGLVELKTKAASLCEAQLLFELTSASKMSKYQQGVVLLGTDLNTKWYVVYFQRRNCIVIDQFDDGLVALVSYKELLTSAASRRQHLTALDPIAEHPPPPGDSGGNGSSSSSSDDNGDNGDGGSRNKSVGGSLQQTMGIGGSKGVTDALDQNLDGCCPTDEVDEFDNYQFCCLLATALEQHTGCPVY
jgi:hypothetical protein